MAPLEYSDQYKVDQKKTGDERRMTKSDRVFLPRRHVVLRTRMTEGRENKIFNVERKWRRNNSKARVPAKTMASP